MKKIIFILGIENFISITLKQSFFGWENNCICLGGKTDFFEKWTIEFGMKNNFNLTNIAL